jgi:hypothetical protein
MPHVPEGRVLTPSERELIAVLAEEASEVVKVCMKMLRFGPENRYPADGEHPGMTNCDALSLECGDFLCMLNLCIDARLIRKSLVHDGESKKRERFEKFRVHRGDGAT